MKKIILIWGIAGLLLVVMCTMFFLKARHLESQLEQANELAQQIQGELKRVQSEKEKALSENEKLHADAVSYLALSSQLQDEKDRLKKRLEEAQKAIEAKEGELQKVKLQLAELEKTASSEKSEEQEKLISEKEELKKKIASLQELLDKERGLYHYNLGVAYAQAKLYDEAIEAYEKSLSFNPDNPDAHYNLGLLYEKMEDDAEKAASHYRKYLELKPDAEDRDEVEAALKKLE